LVVFPTDTVYGLAADPFQPAAVERIYAAKGRPDDKPIAWLISDVGKLRSLGLEVSPEAEAMTERFWPGPLTVILPRASTERGGGVETQGVRMPDHPVALELIRACGGALAVTSANLSGKPDLRSAEAAEAALNGRIPLVLDGGETPGGRASTVVHLAVSPPRILREGPVTRSDLSPFLPDAAG
jgi:L-threonylcarbamoyladenylate synthase